MSDVATSPTGASEALLEAIKHPQPGPCRECGSTMSHRVEAPKNEWASRGKWVCSNAKMCHRRARAKVPSMALDGVPMDETQVIVQTPHPTDRFLLEGVDTSSGPVFTVSEIGAVFFNRSPHWIRWREGQGDMQLDGVEVATSRTPVGAREYTLTDVEQMAHALASHGAIDGPHLINVLFVVQAIARLYGFTA